MDDETKKNIEHAVAESGFPFENYVFTKLREHGWIIISNRLYIDDIKGIEREIDIVAYKCFFDKKENICFYTGLIISCKKSTNKKWCFLTRNSHNNDVNINYFPFHFLTDDERLNLMTYSEITSIEKQYKAIKKIDELYSFPKSIISYQILNEKSFAKNEEIYNSIVTSIKALESEKNNLLKKRKESKENYKRFYSFHLLSLFDGEMIDCNFETDGRVTYSDIDSILYLNRHIVNKEENFYSVHFITRNVLAATLSNYDVLATNNFKIFPRLIDSFYKDIFKSDKKVKLLWDSFVAKTSFAISYEVSKQLHKDLELKLSCYYYEDNNLTFDIDGSDWKDREDVYKVLNEEHTYAYETVKKQLKYLFRYEGLFKFDNLVPF